MHVLATVVALFFFATWSLGTWVKTVFADNGLLLLVAGII